MNPLRSFLADESGAVTADWVVLTGSVVGLGLATMAVVSGGVENLSTDTANSLAGQSSNNLFSWGNAATQLANFNFSNGNADGWFGGQVMDMGGELGELLVLGPHQDTSFLLEIPEGAELAVMEFDLIAGDSLDSSDRWGYDSAAVVLNGVPVVIATDSNSSMTFDIPQVDGTTVEATVTVTDVQLGGSSRWNDSSARISVTVDSPTEPIEFSVESNSNQGINDEFWGLDNFNAEAR